MPAAGFDPAIPASDQPQNLALDRSAVINTIVQSLIYINGDC
jgi:hypothetical protein